MLRIKSKEDDRKKKVKKVKKRNFVLERYQPTVELGLTKNQVNERFKHKLINNTKQRSSKSYMKILWDNIFTFFNFLWALIFIALCFVNAYSDLMFIIVVALNTLISIIQEIRAKITVEKLSLVTVPKVTVIRNGSELQEFSSKLVLDDVVKLSVGNQIPADSIILDGDISVNESLLTGESNAVRKKTGDNLFAGSFIISGICYAKIDKVGKASYIQTMASQARVFKSPSSNLFKDLNSVIRYIGMFILPVGGLLLVNNFFSYSKDWSLAIKYTCGALTGMIPAGMFLLITMALAVGVIKLSAKKTLVQDIYSIEMLARTNMLCLDKTGTITDGTMRVTEIINLNQTSANKNEEIIANVLGVQKTTNSTSNSLIHRFGKKYDYKPKRVIEFSSINKFSGSSFEKRGTYIIGAPDFLKIELNGEIEKLIFENAQSGKRVLMLAGSDEIVEEDELPKDLKPLALIMIEDHIREDAIDTINWFKQNGVKIKIISGDNPITVSNIAKRVGIEAAEKCISLEGMSLQEVEKIADQFTVFGRVSPDQKFTIIKTLKKLGYVVGMTGDGVNDTLALKEADCSIAMADGSEVARNISNLVLLDSKFSSLPSVVKEGRQVINNVQRSSTLFLMKTIFTILLSLITLITLSPYPFKPSQLFLLELFVIGLPSVILALQPNQDLIKGNFIPVVLKQSVPRALIMIANILVVICLNNAGLLTAGEYGTLCTLVLIGTGFINLFFLCMPLNTIRASCVCISAGCLLFATALMSKFFGMSEFTLKVVSLFLVFLALSIALHIFIPKLYKKLRDYHMRKQAEKIRKTEELADLSELAVTLTKIEEKQNEEKQNEIQIKANELKSSEKEKFK